MNPASLAALGLGVSVALLVLTIRTARGSAMRYLRADIASRSREVKLVPIVGTRAVTWRSLPDVLAFVYTISAYGSGLFALAFAPMWLAGAGVVLVAHSIVFAFYLEHECIHARVVRSRRANAHLGTLLTWLDGRIYVPFDALATMHHHHHRMVADFEGFEVEAFLRTRGRGMRSVLIALERWHIPILHFVIRWTGIVSTWRLGGHARRRLAAVLLARTTLFAALGWRSPRCLAGYACAYVLAIVAIRFVDAFQHAYPELRHLDPTRRRSRQPRPHSTTCVARMHRTSRPRRPPSTPTTRRSTRRRRR